MSKSSTPEPESADPSETSQSETSFAEIFSQYEKRHVPSRDSNKQLTGTVISLSADAAILDIGFKSEGLLPLSAAQNAGRTLRPGDQVSVSVKGRDAEGFYELTLGKVERPADWAALEKAFADKSTIVGKVTGVIKGGLSVDVGVRAFMPASRSGVRDSVEMEKMVEQEILCRIIKLDVADEDVVVDRRVVAEEEEKSAQQRIYSTLKEGDPVKGTVRSLTDYGAFVDLGGVDALLHVSDISWTRVGKPADVLAVGQTVEAKVLKLADEAGKRRISIGMKQLSPHPWDAVAGKYSAGERVRGTVTRVAEFGAFVEIEPGIEGLIHVSEMSWGRKLRSASTLVKPGESVDAVILGVNPNERRISLGLKQALGDPWADAAQRFPVGSVVEGPVTSIMKFGAFIQLAEGVEGLVHISEMNAEKRISHPQEMVKAGQIVRAQVLAIDTAKRQMRLSMKQLAPSGLDEYIAEHKQGDVVTGRMLEVSENSGRVELGEGIQATCRMKDAGAHKSPAANPPNAEGGGSSSDKPDLSSLGSMLQARWKSGTPAGESKPDAVRSGQVRKFRISRMDAAAKTIELEMA